MGMNFFSKCRNTSYSRGQPSPKRFTVVHWYVEGGYLVATVDYLDAINFEGRKVLVYENVGSLTELLIRNGGELDPHFSEDGKGPVARFAPTKTGHILAKMLVRRSNPT